MQLSFVALVLASSLLAETTVHSFSTLETTVLRFPVATVSDTEEKITAMRKVEENSFLFTEPTTKELRDPVVSSVFWKTFLKSLKDAENLVNDPTIFKQEEKRDKKEKVDIIGTAQEVAVGEQKTSAIAPSLTKLTGTMNAITSISQSPKVVSSAAPSRTLMRFKVRAGERYAPPDALPKGSVIRTSVVREDKISPLSQRRPINRFPAIAPESRSKAPIQTVLTHSKKSSEEIVEPLEKAHRTAIVNEDVENYRTVVSFKTGLLYKTLIMAAAEKTGHVSFLTDSLYKTQVLAEAVEKQQNVKPQRVEIERSVEVSSSLLSRDEFAKAALQAKDEYFLLNIPSTYFVHDVCALGL